MKTRHNERDERDATPSREIAPDAIEACEPGKNKVSLGASDPLRDQVFMPHSHPMKSLFVTLAFALCPLIVRADIFPPQKLRAAWSEWEDFSKWQIKEFNGWEVPFDGGSKVFFFQSASGDRFEVMAANPAYWTEQDKKDRKQVFLVIRNNRFYRLEPGSNQETELIRMIEDARPGLTGQGKTDPKLLKGLVERIRDRKPMFDVND